LKTVKNEQPKIKVDERALKGFQKDEIFIAQIDFHRKVFFVTFLQYTSHFHCADTFSRIKP
jgi:hypothetical protein